MACKKSDLISAINSFGAARASGDLNLIAYAGRLIGDLIETLEFSPEEPAAKEEPTEEKD
jgi:hypothetical protein